MRSLLDFGAERGARRAYLQVNSDNEPALQMYAKLGFETHHLFHFLSPGTR
jgi:ribosomal protein S18 acetylase RimI-like enzyme